MSEKLYPPSKVSAADIAASITPGYYSEPLRNGIRFVRNKEHE
jgi:hypothetical protein